MALSKRLEFLASFHQREESVYDIGCDHGLLGLSFRTHPGVKNIYLIDPNPYSVDIISNNINAYITEPVKIYPLKQSGEKTKINESNSLIFIAGMGGKTIIEILSAWDKESIQNASQIILSPHRNLLELREYLQAQDFHLIKESVLFEDNYFYEVLSVSKSRPGPRVSLYGESLWESREAESYLHHQMAYLSYHRDTRSMAYLNYLKGLAK